MHQTHAHRNAFWRVLALCTIFLPHTTSAHSWIEQASLIDANGMFTGPQGYPRGYVSRSDALYNANDMTYLLPPQVTGRTRIAPEDLLCHPFQRTQNQSSLYPRLQAAPGSAVAFKYLENGHVTLPQNQPGKTPKGGTVFIFGTEDPRPDEKLLDVLQWTKDGTGGDRRGVLIGESNYDDDRCHQINAGTISTERVAKYPDPFAGQPGTKSELWCENDVVMPATLKAGGTYTVYWVWQWPTQVGVDPNLPLGKDEYYTTCADVDIVAQAREGEISNTLPQQDPMRTAHSDYLSRSALTQDPMALYASISLSTTPSSSNVAQATPTTSNIAQATPATTNSALVLESPAAASSAAVPIVEALPAGGSVVTALITVTATMPPGQATYMLHGTYTAVFYAPTATPSAQAMRRQRRFSGRYLPDF